MTDRRAFLAAALAAPVAIVAPAVAAAPSAISSPLSAGTTPAWNTALRRWKEAEAAAAAFYDQTYGPAFSAWIERVKEQEADLERRIAAVPHYVTKAQTGMPSNRFSLSTEDEWYAGLGRRFAWRIASGDDMSLEDPEFVECCLELAPAAKERDDKVKRMRDSFAPEQFSQALEDEYGKFDDADADAYGALIGFEATTLADLTAKIAFMKERGCDIDHDDLLADLSRIGRIA